MLQQFGTFNDGIFTPTKGRERFTHPAYTTSLSYRVCAEQVVDGESVASSSWPTVYDPQLARDMLVELRAHNDNARYTHWYVIKQTPLVEVTLLDEMGQQT